MEANARLVVQFVIKNALDPFGGVVESQNHVIANIRKDGLQF